MLNKTDIRNTNIRILLIGDDNTNGKVKKIIKKYNLYNNVILTGFRSDINAFLQISNIVLSVSTQEGLPLNILEAIYMKKFIVATNCRGNVDLIHNNENGILVNNINEAWKMIKECYQKIPNYNQSININDYKISSVLPNVTKFYQ